MYEGKTQLTRMWVYKAEYAQKMEENIENKDIERYIKDEMKLVLYNNRGKLQEIQDIEENEW